MTDTVPRVARPRGELTKRQKRSLDAAKNRATDSQAAYRTLVLETLAEGASFNEVAAFTGLSKDTLQRWKREAK